MVYRGRDILLSKLSHQSRTVASGNEAVSALSAEGLNIEPPGLTVPLVVFQKYCKARIQLGYVNGAVVCVLSRWIVDLSTRQGACACHANGTFPGVAFLQASLQRYMIWPIRRGGWDKKVASPKPRNPKSCDVSGTCR